MARKFLFLLNVAVLCLALTACGGGGGGTSGLSSSPGSPASASISVDPSRIDSGDRANLTVVLSDIDRDAGAFLVKIRYSPGLLYRSGSAVIERSNFPDVDLTPVTTTAQGEEFSYTVFYITTGAFPEDKVDIGVIRLQFIGNTAVRDGEIAVDIDEVDRGDVRAFDSSNPQFTALTSVSIRVDEDTVEENGGEEEEENEETNSDSGE